MRPWPFVAANTEPAAPQIAVATLAPVGVAGITGPAVAAAVITVAGLLLGLDGVLLGEVVDDHVEDRRRATG